MALIKETNLYEILIRYGSDGVPESAHYIEQEHILEDGVCTHKKLGVAQPLVLGSPELDDVLTQATNDALAANTTLRVDNATLTAQVTDLTNQNALLQNNNDNLTVQVTDLTNQNIALTKQVLELTDQNVLLQNDNVTLTDQVAALTP